MKGLWMDVPPLSPDTSGFASVLAGTDGLGLIDDVRGCVGNFYMNEEVRPLTQLHVAVSQLSNEDAVLGTGKVLRRRFKELYAQLQPTFAVLCSSPIAALIGTDLHLLAEELESGYGIPVAVVELTGHKTCEAGLAQTLEALADCLAQPGEILPHRVNVLGANYLDWTTEDMDGLKDLLSGAGLELGTVLGGSCTGQELAELGRAQWNWVVHSSGSRAAELLNRRFGTPILRGAPFGAEVTRSLLNTMCTGDRPPEPKAEGTGSSVLILSEQYMGNALRELLRPRAGRISVCDLFRQDRTLAQTGDRFCRDEEELRSLLTGGSFDVILGDPMLRPMAGPDCRWVDLPRIPVSARLWADRRPSLLGQNADRWVNSIQEMI